MKTHQIILSGSLFLFSISSVYGSNEEIAAQDAIVQEAQHHGNIFAFCIPLVVGIAAWQCNLSVFGIFHAIQKIGIPIFLRYYDIKNDINNDILVEKKYPHAQAWYNYLAQKYLAADLDQYQFFENSFAFEKDKYDCLLGRIRFSQESLEMINLLYKKKIEGLQLSPDEEMKLEEFEWILLHEAGHLKNHDCTQGPFVASGATILVEATYQMGKNAIINPSSWPLYIGLHGVIFVGMDYFQIFLYNSYSRFREKRADAFANQYADEKALCGGKRFFENTEKVLSSVVMKFKYLFFTHPAREFTIQAIDKEILRREALLIED